MEAPVYPPATVYARPVDAPFTFGTDTISVAEAAAAPAVNAILIEEAPRMKYILQAPQTQTHISNWSIRSLKTINLISAEQLANIERRLLALPTSARPKL